MKIVKYSKDFYKNYYDLNHKENINFNSLMIKNMNKEQQKYEEGI